MLKHTHYKTIVSGRKFYSKYNFFCNNSAHQIHGKTRKKITKQIRKQIFDTLTLGDDQNLQPRLVGTNLNFVACK